jgi:hypothetical protein
MKPRSIRLAAVLLAGLAAGLFGGAPSASAASTATERPPSFGNGPPPTCTTSADSHQFFAFCTGFGHVVVIGKCSDESLVADYASGDGVAPIIVHINCGRHLLVGQQLDTYWGN